MRYLLILALLLTTPAGATELLIIQSQSNPLYDQSVRLLQNNCAENSKTYIMSDYAEFDLGRIVREERPRLVIAVGDKPLQKSLRLRSIPVLYTMALTAEEQSLHENVTGVSMHTAAEHYLRLLKKLGLRRAGVIYNRAKSGEYLKRARKLAPQYGIELICEQIKSPHEVDAALSRLKERHIDTIWMIPDATAVTAATLDYYFRMGQKANIPVISFSRSYLDKGALAVFEASRLKMTEQLCSTITRILSGVAPADIPATDIAAGTLLTNATVARRLGISFAEIPYPLTSSSEK